MKNWKKDKSLIYLIYFLLLIIFLYIINRYLNKGISENFAAIASKPLTAAQINKLTVDQIKKLTPAQINNLTAAQIKMLTFDQIGAIVPIVIPKISATFFNNLSSLPNNNQISWLKNNQIGEIVPIVISKISATFFNNLTAAQIKMLTPTQIGAIVPIVISKISATFFNNLSSLPNNNQISWLTKNQISAISPNVIPNINATFFNSLTNNQITSLTNNQMNKLTLIQINNINKNFFIMSKIDNFKNNPNIKLINQKIQSISSTVNILKDIPGLQVGIQQNNPPQNISSTTPSMQKTTPSSNVNTQQDIPGLIFGIQQNNEPQNISSIFPSSTIPPLYTINYTQIEVNNIQNIPMIKPSDIPKYNPSFFDYLVIANKARLLTIDQIKAITPDQISEISPDFFKYLNLTKVIFLSDNQIKAITPNQISKISPDFFIYLQDNQVKALTLLQIQAITPDQITLDLRNFFYSLSPDQIKYLTLLQLDKIRIVYNGYNDIINKIFSNLSPEQLSKLTSEQVGSLTLLTLNSIPNTNFQYLNPNGILLLSDDIIKNCNNIRWSNFSQAQKKILNINQRFFNLLLPKGGCPSDPSPCIMAAGYNFNNAFYDNTEWTYGPKHVTDSYYSQGCTYYAKDNNDGPIGTIPCYCRYCM